MNSNQRKELLILSGALALITLLFFVDIFTPFLHNVWFLYTFPLLFSFPLTRKGISYIFSAVITLFILIELFWVNKPVAQPDIWKFSHIYAAITFWLIAFLLERYKRSISFKALNDKLKELNEELLKEVNERMLVEDKLRGMSILDELTGLYNRRGFFELAEKQLAVSKRNKKSVMLVFMDLDNLKRINDASGHKEGDNALIDVSDVMKDTFRKSDIIARIGGDEFVVFSGEDTEGTAVAAVARFQKNIDSRNEGSGRHYELSVSTGYVICHDFEKCSVENLLDKADKSMYIQKALKNQVRPIL